MAAITPSVLTHVTVAPGAVAAVFHERRRCRKPVGLAIMARVSAWQVRRHRWAADAAAWARFPEPGPPTR